LGYSSKQLALLAGVLYLVAGMASASAALGIETDFSGQVSGWFVVSQHDDESEDSIGFRYIPELGLNFPLDGSLTIDAEVAANGYWSNQEEENGDQADAELYRLWLRVAASQYEIRGGLQKIDFGTAVLLRPLMWFDRVDPRDPLGLTEGVYGLLGRYYFLNNANIWLWGLWGNDDTKGWETLASQEDRPEYGGRVQTPFLNGEIALSVHLREVDGDDLNLLDDDDSSFHENRLALDGKWDVGTGIWFESVVVHQESDPILMQYQKFLTIGLDYTFDIGNGLNIIGENLWVSASKELDTSDETASFSAASINYPVGLLDRASAIFYYDWDNEEVYRFVSWERRYDNWQFHFMGFWNPDVLQIYETDRADTLFAGKGVQLLIVFNH
jgi:hypothetical protein